MIRKLSSRLAAARGFLAKLWKLTAPYFWSEERWSARGLLAIVIGGNVFLVYLAKLLNEWNARFFNALQDKNVEAFWAELRYFVILAFIFIVVAVYRLWFRQMLQIRWRRWLTAVYYRDWLAERTYYRMELTGAAADNPEQRIEEDCNTFTGQTLVILLDLLAQVLTLVTFTSILWGLSGSVTVPIFGGLTIPGYMMWVAVAYAAIGSWLTYKIGRPLVRVNFDLQRYNADFRYRMVRVRENAESIALYGGEADEKRRLDGAFGHIFNVWWDFMRYNKRLTWFTAFYSQAADVFPLVVASPRYFLGRDPPWRAHADRRGLRPRAGLAVLVRRRVAAARRMEGHDRSADHVRREHGGHPPGHCGEVRLHRRARRGHGAPARGRRGGSA